ncbi:nitroreductase family protein [Methanobacterium sp.]|uniref:nitroreductase family protein n=1 Tax=Methanobacterium sp. TaxID=2164 RepID=UPI003C786FB0
MEKTEFYPTIFKRKSIRNFDLTLIDDVTLKEISEYLDSLKPIYNDIKTEFKIVSPTYVKRRMMKEAPHYIAVFSEVKEGYLTNIGFMLQQADLFFSTNGLGSCWQGIPAPTKELLNSSNLEFVIFIAFGKPKDPESLHRRSTSEFKRKPLSEITNITGADELLEVARIAPSATNSQPWFFTGNNGIIHAYSTKPGFIKRLMVKKYIPIDVGIAICHLKIAAEHFGKKTEIVFDKTAKINSPNGHEYIVSLKME